MAGQDISKENGKRTAATSALAAVGTVDLLAANHALSGFGWIVALE